MANEKKANPDNEMPPEKGDFEREETPREYYDRVNSGKVKKSCGGKIHGKKKYAKGGMCRGGRAAVRGTKFSGVK